MTSVAHNLEHIVYVGFGGNIGPVPSVFARTLRGMPACGLRPLSFSPVYRSVAQLEVGAPKQPHYWNAVCLILTSLSPRATLQALLRLEAQAGRKREGHWAPRVLDLDLLLYDQQVISEYGLNVPHPRLHERLFVLQPLLDIAPHLKLPNGQVVADVLTDLEHRTSVRVFMEPLPAWAEPNCTAVSAESSFSYEQSKKLRSPL